MNKDQEQLERAYIKILSESVTIDDMSPIDLDDYYHPSQYNRRIKTLVNVRDEIENELKMLNLPYQGNVRIYAVNDLDVSVDDHLEIYWTTPEGKDVQIATFLPTRWIAYDENGNIATQEPYTWGRSNQAVIDTVRKVLAAARRSLLR